MTTPLQQLRDLVDPVKMREEFEGRYTKRPARDGEGYFSLSVDFGWLEFKASRAALVPIIEQMERDDEKLDHAVDSLLNGLGDAL